MPALDATWLPREAALLRRKTEVVARVTASAPLIVPRCGMAPRLPAGVTLVDCAAVPDGGSLTVVLLDEAGRHRRLMLWRGIADMRAGTEHLSLDGQPVEAGSPDEARFLALLDGAAKGTAPPDDVPFGDLARSVAASIVAYVRSDKYRRGWPPPPDPMDEVRALLAAGQRQQAILQYRALFAPIALADARCDRRAGGIARHERMTLAGSAARIGEQPRP